jgi:amine acid ABC transporter, permease protein, 3-TM region, His/Glu/Gln/Arg/opine family
MDELWTYFVEGMSGPLWEGFLASCKLIVCSVPFGLLLGFLVAVGWVYGNKPVATLCRTYVTLVKGTPLLILLFILYFCLPTFGIMLTPFWASVLGFILCNGAYNSEYIRGALLSVRSGQLVAARALGMSRFEGTLFVVIPQAARRAIPGCSNELVYLIKYSSLAYMLSYVELTGAGKMVATRSFRFTFVFAVVGAIYLLTVSVATLLLSLVERKFSIPGFELKRR